jgi:hypothetical protein
MIRNQLPGTGPASRIFMQHRKIHPTNINLLIFFLPTDSSLYPTFIAYACSPACSPFQRKCMHVDTLHSMRCAKNIWRIKKAASQHQLSSKLLSGNF